MFKFAFWSSVCIILMMTSAIQQYYHITVAYFCALIGVILNQSVMAMNGGKMPNPVETNETYIKFDENTRLKFLSDVIPIGIGYASIGDVFLVIGLIVTLLGKPAFG